ncbi:MAG: tetratricopeptide repeat protein [Methanomicrobiaceae archaeon]|nr:tetratricopeptide repeat protein [Methanomicrobiaceae archaeon]
MSLGRVFIRTCEYEKALECIGHALELAPGSASAWGVLAEALFLLERYEEATEVCRRALESQYNTDEIVYYHTLRGLSCQYVGRHGDALASFSRALELNPHNELILVRKGYSHIEEGAYWTALACFDRAAEISPEDAELWAGKAIALFRQDQF